MERLTKRDIKGRVVPKDSFGWRAMEKLAEYEDAEEEGRLVVLPCKVGDTVFAELSYDGGCSEIDTGKVFAIGIDERGTMWVSVRFESGLKYHYPSDNIGKDVFLTRAEAEAEAALEKMKGE